MGAELRPPSAILDRTVRSIALKGCFVRRRRPTSCGWLRLEFRNNEALTELMRGGLGRGRGDAAIALVRRL